MDELHNLFENLRTASTRSVRPTKELAELTIFSSQAEANFRSKSISSPNAPNLASILNPTAPVYGPEGPPPPVPLRPSPTPADDVEMSDLPGDKPEISDNSSESTLVETDTLPSAPPPPYDHIIDHIDSHFPQDEKNDPFQNDIDSVMVNGVNTETIVSVPEKPPPVPPRNKSGLSIQTDTRDHISEDDLWRFGSQQDVTEVIGNVVWRLQCAIKANSIDQTSEEQIDDIRDTFFGANAVYTQKSRSLERKVEPWANLIVFPPQTGSRDIYEALDVVFDEQKVDIANTLTPQYASINKLPPILQIQIQRTAFDPVRQLPWKNRNPVIFPETIYLDRYMDSDDPALMRRRREAWEWKNQLRVLEARQTVLKKTEVDASLPEALLAAKDFISQLQENEIEGVEISPILPEALEERFHEVANELEDINHKIAALKQKLNDQFADLRQYEYQLQTVFIHRGESGGGHYWIYIYDFDNDIWREYNDEYVTEVKDRRRIFDHSSQAGGTPYYLAYVRSADRKNLVDAVVREVKDEVEMSDVAGPWADHLDEAIVMDTHGDDTRHIEHATTTAAPRPLLPKPDAAAAAANWAPGWDAASMSEFDANGKRWD